MSRPRGPTRTRAARLLGETLLLVVVAVGVAALLRIFLVQAFVVPSGSMLPPIEKGDRIVVTKVGGIDRGEVVVFRDPGDWLPARDGPSRHAGPLAELVEFVGAAPPGNAGYLVKRVIGLPGDHVVCCDGRGRLRVNGVPLDETDYLHRGDLPSLQRFDVVVPRDALWVMGDHRSNSGDSRPHLGDGTAFVPRDSVVGRAYATVWPLNDAHRLVRPDTFAAVPGPEQPAPPEPVVRPLDNAAAQR